MKNFDEQDTNVTESEVNDSKENNQTTESGNKGNTFVAAASGAAVGTAFTVFVVAVIRFFKKKVDKLVYDRNLRKAEKKLEEESKGE